MSVFDRKFIKLLVSGDSHTLKFIWALLNPSVYGQFKSKTQSINSLKTRQLVYFFCFRV